MQTKWNLKQLYKSTDDPQIEKDVKKSEAIVTDFVTKWRKNDQYIHDPKVLKEALDEYEHIHAIVGIYDKPIYYFLLLNNLDQTDTNIKGRLNQLSAKATNLSNEIQFFLLNVSKIQKQDQKEFLDSKDLKEYNHFLEFLFKSSEYLLSEKEERVFNLTSKTSSSNWSNMVSELLDKQEIEVRDEEGKKISVNYNDISKYLNSKNRKVRDYASKQFNKVNEKYIEIAEFEINSILEAKKISDEYRCVPRPDLLRHISDDMESEVVDKLIEVVSKNFDISQKYYKLKAKHLKQKTLGYHERNIPLGEIEREYTFEEGIEIVQKSFRNLDSEFEEILNRYLDDGHFDVYPNKGKSGGGFCISINDTLPTYILLNHNKKLNDILTIAHETGHGIHSEFSKVQNSLNSGYPTSLAEVASTFFEDFVLEEILKSADDDLRFNILDQKLSSDISSIFRQVAFYTFEKELHSTFREKGYVSKDVISDIFCKHMSSYLGDAVDVDESMRYGWVYWSHLRNFFYVYSYASGLLISKALQSIVRKNPKDISLVKEFLSSGSTKSPIELFKGMGVDIMGDSFWEKGLLETKKLLNGLIK